MNEKVIDYHIKTQIDLNRSYMPFVQNGGLFIPTNEVFMLNETVIANIKLPNADDYEKVKGIVVWITPPNAVDYPSPGIGIQFVSENAAVFRELILATLDTSYEVSGYIFGNL